MRKKVAILRALKLGDLMVTIPAFRSIRKSMPDAEISLIGLPWSQWFVERYKHYIDRLIEFPGYPGLPEREYDSANVLEFIKQMQMENFDLVLQMHGNGTQVNSLIGLFDAKQTAGFYRPGDYCPDQLTFTPYKDDVPMIENLLSLTKHLGMKDFGRELEFPIFEEDKKAVNKLLQKYGLQAKKYVCIHPGCLSAQAWDVENFAKAGDTVARLGYKVVLTGIESEKPITEKTGRLMKNSSIDLAGQTDLDTLAALLKESKLLICNDTGVSHMADALKVPSVVIYTTSSPSIWGPLDRELHRAVKAGSKSERDSVINEALKLISTI